MDRSTCFTWNLRPCRAGLRAVAEKLEAITSRCDAEPSDRRSAAPASPAKVNCSSSRVASSGRLREQFSLTIIARGRSASLTRGAGRAGWSGGRTGALRRLRSSTLLKRGGSEGERPLIHLRRGSTSAANSRTVGDHCGLPRRTTWMWAVTAPTLESRSRRHGPRQCALVDAWVWLDTVVARSVDATDRCLTRTAGWHGGSSSEHQRCPSDNTCAPDQLAIGKPDTA